MLNAEFSGLYKAFDAMDLKLRYRNGFIDVDESSEGEPRARSLPPDQAPCQEECLRRYVDGLAQRLSRNSSWSPLSKGSFGHPELCNRPCVFQDCCENRNECTYCHLPHERSPKMDKRQRLIVKSLSEGELVALVLYFIRASVHS